MVNDKEEAESAPFPVFASWRARGRILSVLLPAICVLPLLVGLLQRAFKGRIDLIDFQGTVCAAQRHAAGLSVYSEDFTRACSPGGFSYPYPPLFLDLTTGLLNMIGVGGLWSAYIALYVISIIFIIAATLRVGLKRWAADAAANRTPVLTVWTGAPIAWGNFGIPFHAIFLGCALIIPRWPLLFALSAAAISIVKPQLIVYATVLVFAVRPFWKGVAFAALAGVLAAGLLGYNVLAQSPEEMTAWRQSFGEVAHTGTGAFQWLEVLGLDSLGYPALGAAFALAGLLVLAGLAIARGGGLDSQASAMLGIAVVTIALPRVNDYDLLTVGPGLLALLAATRGGSASLFMVISNVILAALLTPIVMEWLDLGNVAAHMRHLTLVAVVLVVGVFFAARLRHASTSVQDQPSRV